MKAIVLLEFLQLSEYFFLVQQRITNQKIVSVPSFLYVLFFNGKFRFENLITFITRIEFGK